MRIDQVARVAVAGIVLGAVSTTSVAAVSLTSAPATPVPTPTFAASDPEDEPPMDGPHVPENPAPVDGATIVAAAVGPALEATRAVPVPPPARTVAAAVPRAVHQAAPVVVPAVGPVAPVVPVASVVEGPVVREVPLPRGVRAQVRRACAMDLLDDEMCGWLAQGRSSSR